MTDTSQTPWLRILDTTWDEDTGLLSVLVLPGGSKGRAHLHPAFPCGPRHPMADGCCWDVAAIGLLEGRGIWT
jgi:hypothetical protein